MRVAVEAPDGSLYVEGRVSMDADLDGRFLLAEDDGSRLMINGWLCYVEVIG